MIFLIVVLPLKYSIGALCNEATIVNDTALGGNATDRAILQFVEKTPVLKF